ncbi:MAG TPA: rhodanese-like domain-containing protein [Thermoanaerobaculia bacterium]
MAKNRTTESTQTQPKRKGISPGAGFALGILAGLAIVAAIWFAYQSGRESAAPQSAVTPAPAAPAAQPQEGQLPPPVPAISDAEAQGAPRITAQEAKQLVDAGRATVVDTRDPQSFAAGHIPGALQIPLAFVQSELPWFPRDRKLIFYCT